MTFDAWPVRVCVKCKRVGDVRGPILHDLGKCARCGILTCTTVLLRCAYYQ